ncbi:hypothetical protein J4E85_009752 [Alternaria conjuncta]|uniref:uncharacterized protein n=1 Tax=Alternaria viburni TaxID=566460 RepID=UPI0020C1E223|nr:uncharacterized protein J4E79_001157 [Alternaria viburni]XP_051322374.1 uncharacterized protein J4E85_009752 [Alternaria conjuncta]KAI4669114.1 hypothetical protein J4E79_001157 [Alternaria viburni]KAI4918962.1 hypothetical protein J4E85_009752 [Alternaria conjuncta]
MPSQPGLAAKSLRKTNVPSVARSFLPKALTTTIRTAPSTLKNVSPYTPLLQAQQLHSRRKHLPAYPLNAPAVMVKAPVTQIE